MKNKEREPGYYWVTLTVYPEGRHVGYWDGIDVKGYGKCWVIPGYSDYYWENRGHVTDINEKQIIEDETE